MSDGLLDETKADGIVWAWVNGGSSRTARYDAALHLYTLTDQHGCVRNFVGESVVDILGKYGFPCRVDTTHDVSLKDIETWMETRDGFIAVSQIVANTVFSESAPTRKNTEIREIIRDAYRKAHPFMVGEVGPELFTPIHEGTIKPATDGPADVVADRD